MHSALKGNDLEAPVSKFCLLLEEDRRTPEGRIRSSKQFREHYFFYDDRAADDRIFSLMPPEVRGPILSSWGIRGPRSASKDPDEKVRSVVYDALLAGDIDDFFFEEGLPPAVVIKWVDLADWWTFFRRGPLTRHAMRKALETGHALGLFQAKWFIDSLRCDDGRLQGTDVLTESLSKIDLVEWVRAIHQSGDGSPKGLVAALGWDKIVTKLPDDALLHVIDALAHKCRLVTATSAPTSEAPRRSAPPSETPAASGRASVEPSSRASVEPSSRASVEPSSRASVEPTSDPKADPAAASPDAPAATVRGLHVALPPPPRVPSESRPEPASEPVPTAAVTSHESGEYAEIEVDEVEAEEPAAPPEAASASPSVREPAASSHPRDPEEDEEEPGRYRLVSSRPQARASQRPPAGPVDPIGDAAEG